MTRYFTPLILLAAFASIFCGAAFAQTLDSNVVVSLVIPDTAAAKIALGKSGISLLLETQDFHPYGADLLLPAKTNLIQVLKHDFAFDLESLWKETSGGFQVTLFKGATNSPPSFPGFHLRVELKDAPTAEALAQREIDSWKKEGRIVIPSQFEGRPYYVIEKNRLILNGQTNALRPYFLTGPLFYCAAWSNQFVLTTSQTSVWKALLSENPLAQTLPDDAKGKTAFMTFSPGETEKLFFGPAEKLTNGNSIVDSDLVLGSFMSDVSRVSLSYTSRPDADELRFLFQSAAASRPFMRILKFDTNSAAPPDFVKEDAESFHRYRVNMPDFFYNFEKQLGGFARLIVETVGKDKDPNFDTRTNIFQITGNDIVYYEMAAGASNSPPAKGLLFIGSSNPAQLGSNVQTFVTSLLPGSLSSFSQTNKAGVSYSAFSLPPMPMWGLNTTTQTVAFTVYSNYLVFASETSALEKFLSPGRTNLLPLAQSAGWKNAQAVLAQTHSALGYSKKQMLAGALGAAGTPKTPTELQLYFSAGTSSNGLDLRYVLPVLEPERQAPVKAR